MVNLCGAIIRPSLLGLLSLIHSESNKYHKSCVYFTYIQHIHQHLCLCYQATESTTHSDLHSNNVPVTTINSPIDRFFCGFTQAIIRCHSQQKGPLFRPCFGEELLASSLWQAAWCTTMAKATMESDLPQTMNKHCTPPNIYCGRNG